MDTQFSHFMLCLAAVVNGKAKPGAGCYAHRDIAQTRQWVKSMRADWSLPFLSLAGVILDTSSAIAQEAAEDIKRAMGAEEV